MQLLSETIKIQVPVEVGGQIFVVFVASDSRKGVFMWYPIDMRSFRPTTFRLDLSPFARWNTTLYNTVKILIRDVILVKLGFHMCIPCLYACFFFSGLKNGKYTSSKRTVLGRNELRAKWPNPDIQTPRGCGLTPRKLRPVFFSLVIGVWITVESLLFMLAFKRLL